MSQENQPRTATFIPKLTDEDLSMFSYFWREKGNVERWCDWDERKEIFQKERPELFAAWNNYKIAVATLNALTQ